MDLNAMMRQTTLDTLNSQHEAAVVNGDVAGAKAISDKIADFKIAIAPKPATGFGDTEVKAELNKLDWFGADPKKSAKAMEFARNMSPAKFATPEAYVAAVVKAMEDDAAPAPATGGADEDEDDDGVKPEPKAARRTDGPRADDTSARGRGAGGGAWVKLSDAPKDIQTRIKGQATKFLPANATDDQKKKFTERALSSAYADHQRKAGK